MYRCLGYAPNTYLFSKNLAEMVIQDYSSSFSCAIVRPSIVMPTITEPFPGWIDNIYGPIGIFLGGGKGITRVACLNKTVGEDVVPVDVVIKAVIITSWKIGLPTFTDSTPFILNCTNQRYVTYQDCIKLLFSVLNEIPLEGTIWTPHTILTDNYVLFYILTILLHILPAILIDLILKFSGRQSMLVQLQRRIYVANHAVSYFSFHEWKYSNANWLTLMSSIPHDNLNMFSFDYFNIDIKKYCIDSAIGAKKFILHEDMNRLDAARAHSKKIYLFTRIIKTIIYIGILWIIYKWTFFDTL